MDLRSQAKNQSFAAPFGVADADRVLLQARLDLLLAKIATSKEPLTEDEMRRTLMPT